MVESKRIPQISFVQIEKRVHAGYVDPTAHIVRDTPF